MQTNQWIINIGGIIQQGPSAESYNLIFLTGHLSCDLIFYKIIQFIITEERAHVSHTVTPFLPICSA